MIKITEENFKAAAELLLPPYIIWSGTPYMLASGYLMGGGCQLYYWNSRLKQTQFREMDDDPIMIIKYVARRMVGCLDLYPSTKEVYEKDVRVDGPGDKKDQDDDG